MAINFFWIFTENNPVIGYSKTFFIPEAKGLIIVFVNETKSGHPNKCLFHWHFENLMGSFFYYGRICSAKLDRWQARSNGLNVDQRLVEQTAYRTEIKRPCDNGYKSVFTNPWLLRQKNRSSINGLGKNQQKEWTRSLFAVPFVRATQPWPHGLRETIACIHVNRNYGTPRVACWQVFLQNSQKSECVLSRYPLSGTNKFACLDTLRRELVKTKSDMLLECKLRDECRL